MDCFSGFAQARYKGDDGYKSNWYDVDNEVLPLGETIGPKRGFSFKVPEKKGTLYITAESYYLDMIPESCYKDST